MRDYVHTHQDSGGVHFNSGIPNRAFHRTAMALQGYAWERAGRIWYDALCTPRRGADCDFAAFAALTRQAAAERYGVNSVEEDAVRQGWQDVGVSS